MSRAVRGAARAAGASDVAAAPDLASTVGNTGTPHAGLMLCAVLDEAEPGQTVMVIHLADGVEVGFYQTTDAIADYSPSRSVADQIAAGNEGLDYQTFLTWRGFLNREPPRRPEPTAPAAPAAPPSLRSQQWKYGFGGSRDRSSGAIHLPPQPVSIKGGAVDEMEPVPMADVAGTVAAFTIDGLAYSLSPAGCRRCHRL